MKTVQFLSGLALAGSIVSARQGPVPIATISVVSSEDVKPTDASSVETSAPTESPVPRDAPAPEEPAPAEPEPDSMTDLFADVLDKVMTLMEPTFPETALPEEVSEEPTSAVETTSVVETTSAAEATPQSTNGGAPAPSEWIPCLGATNECSCIFQRQREIQDNGGVDSTQPCYIAMKQACLVEIGQGSFKSILKPLDILSQAIPKHLKSLPAECPGSIDKFGRYHGPDDKPQPITARALMAPASTIRSIPRPTITTSALASSTASDVTTSSKTSQTESSVSTASSTNSTGSAVVSYVPSSFLTKFFKATAKATGIFVSEASNGQLHIPVSQAEASTVSGTVTTDSTTLKTSKTLSPDTSASPSTSLKTSKASSTTSSASISSTVSTSSFQTPASTSFTEKTSSIHSSAISSSTAETLSTPTSATASATSKTSSTKTSGASTSTSSVASSTHSSISDSQASAFVISGPEAFASILAAHPEVSALAPDAVAVGEATQTSSSVASPAITLPTHPRIPYVPSKGPHSA